MSDPAVSSPPLVPEGFDVDIYVVLGGYGPIGRAYREIDEEKADRETLIRHLIEGQYERVLRIVAFDTAQGWSRDVSTEIALEVVERARAQGEELTGLVRKFVYWELERAERRQLGSGGRKTATAHPGWEGVGVRRDGPILQRTPLLKRLHLQFLLNLGKTGLAVGIWRIVKDHTGNTHLAFDTYKDIARTQSHAFDFQIV
jgi:hypothetical protein